MIAIGPAALRCRVNAAHASRGCPSRTNKPAALRVGPLARVPALGSRGGVPPPQPRHPPRPPGGSRRLQRIVSSLLHRPQMGLADQPPNHGNRPQLAGPSPSLPFPPHPPPPAAPIVASHPHPKRSPPRGGKGREGEGPTHGVPEAGAAECTNPQTSWPPDGRGGWRGWENGRPRVLPPAGRSHPKCQGARLVIGPP